MMGDILKMSTVIIMAVISSLTGLFSQTVEVRNERMVTIEFEESFNGSDRIYGRSEKVEHRSENKLNVRLYVRGGETITLNLLRRNFLDFRQMKAVIAGDEKGGPIEDAATDVSFYHGPEMNAVITSFVDTDAIGGHLRKMLGTFTYSSKMYEIQPIGGKVAERDHSAVPGEHYNHVLREVVLPEQKLSGTTLRYFQRLKEKEQTTATRRTPTERNRNIKSAQEDPAFIPKPISLDQKEFYVEMIFILDLSIFNFWMTEHSNDEQMAISSIRYYFAHLYHGMYTAYTGMSIVDDGLTIIPWLREIRIVTNAAEDARIAHSFFRGQKLDTIRTEDLLREYMSSERLTWQNVDALLLFSRRTFVFFQEEGLIGLAADVCAICDKGFAQSYDYGLFSWSTASHELGHLLGAHHDGTLNDCDPNDKFLMTPESIPLVDPTYKNSFKFSRCSVDMFKRCLSGRGNDNEPDYARTTRFPRTCVYDKICSNASSASVSNSLNELPGRKIGLNEQCEIGTGVQGAVKSTCQQISSKMCKKLLCDIPWGDSCTQGQNPELRAYDGTPCDTTNPQMVCYEGDCVLESSFTYSPPTFLAECQLTSCSVPRDCVDSLKSEVVTCEEWVLLQPWDCFDNGDARRNCKATCFTYGLQTDVNPVCSISHGDVCYNNASRSTVWAGNTRSVTHVPEATSREFFSYCAADVHSTNHEWRIQCPGTPEMCIYMSWACDGEVDCPQASDENRGFCVNLPSGVSGYTRCYENPAFYILSSWVCDGHPDCDNGTDELACPSNTQFIQQCYTDGRTPSPSQLNQQPTKYNCPDSPHVCIIQSKFCDDVKDCPYGADENDCGETGGAVAQYGLRVFFKYCLEAIRRDDWKRLWIQCPEDAGHCIETTWACDGVPDCPNAGDESKDFCENVPYFHDWSRCPSNPYLVIHENWWCDGEIDCPGGNDENREKCNHHIVYCSADHINCPSAPHTCVHFRNLCDGTVDCMGGGDEAVDICGKPSHACRQSSSPCMKKGKLQCVPNSAFCDLNIDCDNGLDEMLHNCRKLPAVSCPSKLISCPSFGYKCVSSAQLCDGVVDCPLGTDEENCTGDVSFWKKKRTSEHLALDDNEFHDLINLLKSPPNGKSLETEKNHERKEKDTHQPRPQGKQNKYN